MNYRLYEYRHRSAPKRPRRRSTGWIVLHRITVGTGVGGIVEFFTSDPEGVATVTVRGAAKQMDAMRQWKEDGVPEWAMEKAFVPYHFIIDKSGKIFRMLADDARGAHCAGLNNSSIGVGVIGDFRKRHPTGAQVLSAKKLCRNLIRRYRGDIDRDEAIIGHDEFCVDMKGDKPGGCPGNLFPTDEIRAWSYLAADIMGREGRR